MRGNQKVIAAFLTLLLLAIGLTGSKPGPLSFVHETCYDGIDNDMDGTYGGSFPLVLADQKDGECIWMPHKEYGAGEHDGDGLNDPAGGYPSVDAYVVAWLNGWSEEVPTHFEMVKALLIETSGAFSCSGPQALDLQDSLTAYKNGYGLPNEMTGALEHQAECGVSY